MHAHRTGHYQMTRPSLLPLRANESSPSLAMHASLLLRFFSHDLLDLYAGHEHELGLTRHDKLVVYFLTGGMGDRRMRLSLHVARRFFALQHKLGFDKTSKTVQWLLDMSTTGVNHLLTASTAYMSLSEDASGLVLLDNNDHIIVD